MNLIRMFHPEHEVQTALRLKPWVGSILLPSSCCHCWFQWRSCCHMPQIKGSRDTWPPSTVGKPPHNLAQRRYNLDSHMCTGDREEIREIGTGLCLPGGGKKWAQAEGWLMASSVITCQAWEFWDEDPPGDPALAVTATWTETSLVNWMFTGAPVPAGVLISYSWAEARWSTVHSHSRYKQHLELDNGCQQNAKHLRLRRSCTGCYTKVQSSKSLLSVTKQEQTAER